MIMKLTFGEKIRNLREDANLTQEQLGKQVNMTQRKVSCIEHNQYEPSIEDIKALCSFFKVSSDYLIGLSNNPEKQK